MQYINKTIEGYLDSDPSLTVKTIKTHAMPFIVPIMSRGTGFATMWYVRPAKPQISLRILAG